jgi:hypothetical protein
MHAAHTRNRLIAASLGLGLNTGCNALLDIERRQVLPLSVGDAAVDAGFEQTTDAGAGVSDAASNSAHETTSEQAVTSATTPATDVSGETSAASTAPASGSLSEIASDVSEGSSDVSSVSGESTSELGTFTDVNSASTSSAPPPDPRYNKPTQGPNLDVGFGCAAKLDDWGQTSYCRFTPNGFDRNGNPLDNVGDIHLWIYWSEAAVDGWICVIDNVANGRGIKYQVGVHPKGTPLPTLPSDNVTPSGGDWLIALQGRDNEATYGACDWVGFSAAATGDQVMVEWLDLWTSQHFDGRIFFNAP